MIITTDWLEDNDYNSVTDFCRYLVTTGIKDGSIEVYRNEVISYTVSSIYTAAKFKPDGNCFRPCRRLAEGH